MAGTNNLINELLEKTTKQQLLDDFYYAYSKKLELQERVKELEEKLEMILNLNKNLLDKINSLTKDDTLNVRILKSELDIDYEQLEIMFRFLPENKLYDTTNIRKSCVNVDIEKCFKEYPDISNIIVIDKESHIKNQYICYMKE
jgi:uncharacterized protein (DUF2344 family)